MAEHDDLDVILDSALDDFRIADDAGASNPRASEGSFVSRGAPENAPLGQVSGIGLPALGPREERAGLVKATCIEKTSPASGLHLADMLEELAQQTRQTLESLNTSDQEAMADKLVENIVKQLEELGHSQDTQSIMDTMMRQLLSKEVLHEPMKEFCEKYPGWLEANRSSLISEEDFSRYSRQYGYIKELCRVYESTPDDFDKIVDIMQNMQACGQPPNDLVQELAPGMDLGGDGLPLSALDSLVQEGDQAPGLNQNCNMM